MALRNLRTLFEEVERSWAHINATPQAKAGYHRVLREQFSRLMWSVQIRDTEQEIIFRDERREIVLCSLNICNRYINFFGPAIARLTIHYVGLNQATSHRLHELIAQSCYENLTEIRFIGLQASFIDRFATFPLVQTLFILNSDLGFRLPSFASFFPNTRKLEMENVRSDNFIAFFEQLEYLRIKSNSYEVGYGISSASALWYDNRNLRMLEIDLTGATGMPMEDLLNSINVRSLVILKVKTEVVTTNVTRDEVDDLVTSHPELIELHLSYMFSMDDVVFLINQLSRLNQFAYQMTMGDMWSMDYAGELELALGNDWRVSVSDDDFVELTRNV